MVNNIEQNRGTLLERNVLRLLKKAGFIVKNRTRIKGYEIDVYAISGHHKIIFECKQYENSPLEVKNLIHEWDSKNKEINASKIVLVLYGIKVSPANKALADKYDITIWTEKDLDEYDKLVNEHPKTTKNFILNDLGISIGKGRVTSNAKAEVVREEDNALLKDELEVERLLSPSCNSIFDGLDDETIEKIKVLREKCKNDTKGCSSYKSGFWTNLLIALSDDTKTLSAWHEKRECAKKIKRLIEEAKLKDAEA